MTRPRISVVIPVKNERTTVRACIEGILGQTLSREVEIIFLDSGSTDGTLDILQHYPVRVHEIPASEFNHGETRNAGVRMARGELVALTVADARPQDGKWLERMARHFEDPQVAGVCGQQVVPHERDKNPLQWFRPFTKPVARRVHFPNPGEFDQLPPKDQIALCGWDDVTAMYRRSVLLALPFQKVNFSEDGIWARDALRLGHALVYDYAAKVYHYHHETFRFRFRRTYTIKHHSYEHFRHVGFAGWVLPKVARQTYHALFSKLCPERRLFWWLYNVRLALAEWLADWLFWATLRFGGELSLRRSHDLFCRRAPQPPRKP
jgi:rhamnosyltransferase